MKEDPQWQQSIPYCGKGGWQSRSWGKISVQQSHVSAPGSHPNKLSRDSVHPSAPSHKVPTHHTLPSLLFVCWDVHFCDFQLSFPPGRYKPINNWWQLLLATISPYLKWRDGLWYFHYCNHINILDFQVKWFSCMLQKKILKNTLNLNSNTLSALKIFILML